MQGGEDLVPSHELQQDEVVNTSAETVMLRRFHHITNLEPGWAGPGSLVPAVELVELLEPLVADLIASPHEVHVGPTAEGSIALEWCAGNVEYTAEVHGNGQLFLMTDNVVTDEIVSRDIPYDPEAIRGLLLNGEL